MSKISTAIQATTSLRACTHVARLITHALPLSRFIYEAAALSGLPWVYGGEYGQFAEVVARIVHAWLSVGLRLYFVFDGAFCMLSLMSLLSE